MRILLVSSSSGSKGGGELFLLSLGEALARKGHHVLLWASDHERMNPLCNRFDRFGEVHRAKYTNTYDRRLRNLTSAIDLPTARRVAAHWRSLKPDIIHLNKQNLEDAPELLWAANISRIPAVCSVHVTQDAGHLGARFGKARDFVARRALQSFRGPLVAIGKSRLLDLRRFLRSNEKTVLISNGVQIPSEADLRAARPAGRAKLALSAGQFLCLGVGRMVEQKRPILFLHCAKKIAERVPDSIFCWVGDGPLRTQWDRFVEENGLSKRVFVTGWVEDVRPYYAAADLLLHTAAYEGLPLALLEAMAAGLPCALTPNLMQDFGFLTKEVAITVDEISDTWTAQVVDAEQRSRRGSASRQIVSNQFSLERMADEYERLYWSAMAESTHAHRVLHSA
jgi:glycosyltransferase involved in cell wall biosynthesis